MESITNYLNRKIKYPYSYEDDMVSLSSNMELTTSEIKSIKFWFTNDQFENKKQADGKYHFEIFKLCSDHSDLTL